MDFSLTTEQLELRRMLRDVTADHCSSARLREVIATPSAEDTNLWRLLTQELGLMGVAVPEEAGGLGGSFVDAAVVIEEAGRGLWPTPIVTSLAAVSAIGRTEGVADVLAELVSGEHRAAVVAGDGVTVSTARLTGEVDQVIGAQDADRLVVATGDGLWLVESAYFKADSRIGVDRLRPLSTVRLADARGRRLADATAAARAVDVLRVALAVEAVGVAQWCLDTTVAYIKTREQFGKPIGSFQALAHRASDLAVDLASATSTAYYAAWAVDGAPDELAVVAPLAKAVCGEAAYRIAAETIQMHGGIGFTWEHDAHLYFKRATGLRLLLGDSHQQRQLVATRASLFV
ncbi:MAG TPA: acyl-CoA dehydrogenase family protein [Mycobacteriales bacterium]|jgi:alkylation response protein AidB-like acyl-CoA dehydrogenase|nr:acyl-CoA dehydrogenase family protein [Mycobacteriales bacterium]